MRWLEWRRSPWIVAGLSLTLLLAALWAAGTVWAVEWNANRSGAILWRGSIVHWWPPGDHALTGGSWQVYAHGEPMIWRPAWRTNPSPPMVWVILPLWVPLTLVAAPSFWFAWRKAQHLTWYAGCDPSQIRYSAGPQLSLCHGGLLWRSQVLNLRPLVQGSFGGSAIVDLGPLPPAPPGYTGPAAITAWKLSPSTLWWNKHSETEPNFRTVFFPGWLFVAASAALTWCIAALLPRRAPPPDRSVAPSATRT